MQSSEKLVRMSKLLKRLLRILIKYKKSIFRALIIVFLVLNFFSYIAVYALTHYNFLGHIGLGLSRPTNSRLPTDMGLTYVTRRIPINRTEWLETWLIPAQSSLSQGTLLLFPGNGGSKGKQLLAPTKVFHNLHYDSLLVDFRGVGGSSGNTTTLGVREAEDVALAVNYAEKLNLKHPIVLYGVSMGSAAILRAIAQGKIHPDAIILELPFARLLDAVKSRLKFVKIPTFPTAELLVFWGSIQHRFNGFAHNPVNYAKQVSCPTLVFQGKDDKWTNIPEIKQLTQNIPSDKQLVIFPTAGHELLVTIDSKLWQQSVDNFLKGL